MSDAKEYLKEWFKRFIENRDIYFKKIKEIISEEEGLKVVRSDKTTVYAIVPFSTSFLKDLERVSEKNKGIIVYNTAENFKILIKEWPKLVKNESLMIYFVNPFSKLDKKWVINPRTHALISDDASLKEGLNALYISVDATTQKEVELILK